MCPPRGSTTGAKRDRRTVRRFGSDTKRVLGRWINKSVPSKDNGAGISKPIILNRILKMQSVSSHPTADRIEQVAFGFMASKGLFSAIELGLFTELAKGPLDADAVLVRLMLHPRAIRDFLDMLVAAGMLERGDPTPTLPRPIFTSTAPNPPISVPSSNFGASEPIRCSDR